MRRLSPTWAFASLISFCGCLSPIVVAGQESPDAADDIQIYSAFLENWSGPGHKAMNVSQVAKPPTKEDIDDFTECASDKAAARIPWVQINDARDLRGVIDKLAYVHLVDPWQWRPLDPEDSMAKGQSVESAVDAGFAGGLMTFSAISYDESHEIAAFTYSFVCGSLCGNGGSVVFKKTTAGWSRAEKSCGAWLS